MLRGGQEGRAWARHMAAAGGGAVRVALVVAVAVLSAVGCATSERTETGSAAAEDQKGRDTIDCLNMARSSTAGPQGPRMVVNQDRYQQCMRERGHAATPAR